MQAKRLLVAFSAIAMLFLSSGQIAVVPGAGYLGVTYAEASADEAKARGWPAPRGIKLTQVIQGTPAEKAGLRVGDIVLDIAPAKLLAAEA